MMCQKRILNGGCGNSHYGTHRIDIIKSGATTKIFDLEKGLPYKSNFFDEVFCRYVFEHLKNPYKLLLEMKRVCKPHGKIIIITDNAGYLFYHIKLRGRPFHGDYSDKAIRPKKFNSKDFHFGLYTLEHLRNFFNSAELKISENNLVFWSDVTSKKSILFHKISRFIFGKRLAMPSIKIVGEKNE